MPVLRNGKIVIVGGGLAGLVAARRLHEAGLPFELIEARDRFGGRILTAGLDGLPSIDGFDLGPSWFWPEMQAELTALVGELGLAHFRQQEQGDIVVQSAHGAAIQRYPGNGFGQATSARIAGGTAALIAALVKQLPSNCLRTEMMVRDIRQTGDGCVVHCVGPRGAEVVIEAHAAILAMPPRLVAGTIGFDPPLDGATVTGWLRTPTWMASHAKFLAIYDQPFWREMGMSGAGRSMIGPLVEIHDATTASGQAALFGFVGVPASQRAEAGKEAVVAAAVEQLAAMYGPRAPIATLYKDWAADPLTATPEDIDAPGHPDGLRSARVEGPWAGRLYLAGSEASAREPGYLAGAVDAAERAVSELIALRDVTDVRVPADEDRS
jgi:monoamine oxidase